MELHAAGQLVPALRAALERPLPLPAAVSAAQAAGAAAAVALAGAVAAWLLVWRRRAPTYLLDFECYRPGGCCGMARGARAAADGVADERGRLCGPAVGAPCGAVGAAGPAARRLCDPTARPQRSGTR